MLNRKPNWKHLTGHVLGSEMVYRVTQSSQLFSQTPIKQTK